MRVSDTQDVALYYLKTYIYIALKILSKILLCCWEKLFEVTMT
jgi:hypothetical protein